MAMVMIVIREQGDDNGVDVLDRDGSPGDYESLFDGDRTTKRRRRWRVPTTMSTAIVP